MRFTRSQTVSLIFYIFLVIFWGFLFILGKKEGFYNYLYSFLFGLIPLFGGVYAMINAKLWGGLRSAIGKAVFFIGLGIFCWGFGETVWSYYNFFQGVAAPYPSLADLGFAPSIFFYGLGAFYLSKATGAKYGLRNKFVKILVLLSPLYLAAISYYLLIVVARGGVIVPQGEPLLKAFLDVAYPVGDFIGVTIAVIVSGLSFKYFGGRYMGDIISVLLGLFVMFVADTIFSYTTTVASYYNGDFGDLLLCTGMFLLTFGVLGFTENSKLNSI